MRCSEGSQEDFVMGYSDRMGFFYSRPVRRTQEELRSLLRVMPGGLAAAALGVPNPIDPRTLGEDRFLREHFLDRSYPASIIVRPPDDAS